MSTTDTIRAAFVAAKAKMIRTGDGWTDFEMFEAGHKAATEAAKATGTAQTKQSFENIEELVPLPEEIEVGGEGWGWEDFQSEKTFSVEHMLYYGAACAQAAFAEAARQPAPVVVKPWETRMQEYFAQGSVKMRTPASFMADEIIDSRAALAATAAPVAATQHPDDIAVDKFAVAMKNKMAASRTKGRGGWENPEECGIEDLACMLVQHVEKGDPVDIGNFCMMIWNRVRDTGPDTYAPIVEAFLSYAGNTAKPAPVVPLGLRSIDRDTDKRITFIFYNKQDADRFDADMRAALVATNRSQP